MAGFRAVTPFPKPDPGNMRESNRPVGPERIAMKKRHGAEQIVGLLRQADVALGKGQKVPEVCKQLGISEQTYYVTQHLNERIEALCSNAVRQWFGFRQGPRARYWVQCRSLVDYRII